jgi:hypothetical protein
MVRALLNCTKSQTRRPLRDQSPVDLGAFKYGGHFSRRPVFDKVAKAVVGHRLASVHCPYGQPGDQIWVRETFFAFGRWETRYSEKKKRDEWHFIDMTLECDRAYQFAADNPDLPLAKDRGLTPGWWKRPAIFMPRAACRITLENASVRVERLQDISEDDAIAEGVDGPMCAAAVGRAPSRFNLLPAAIHGYSHLWESLNGAGSWDANPWVWVVEFRRIEK